MVQLLVEQGSNVHQGTNRGRPVILAAGSPWQGRSEVEVIPLINSLLDHGSVVNATVDNGRSPLHYLPPSATREFCGLLLQNRADVVRLLLDIGVNLHAVNKEVLTLC